MGIRTLDSQVREILKDNSYTRNNDIDLWIKVLEVYYFDYVSFGSVKLEDLHKLPREDHVKRIRAVVQNDEGLYLPTDPSVLEKRGWAQDGWGNYVRKKQVHLSHEKPSTPVVKASEVHQDIPVFDESADGKTYKDVDTVEALNGQAMLLDVPPVEIKRNRED